MNILAYTVLIMFIVLISVVVGYFLGYGKSEAITPEKVKAKIEKMINPPESGVIKRKTADDVRQEKSPHKGQEDAMRDIIPKLLNLDEDRI